MKRKSLALLLVTAVVFLLVSCGTSVAVSTLVPAEVSLGKGDTIAIATPHVSLSNAVLNLRTKGVSGPAEVQSYLSRANSSTYSRLESYVADELKKALSGGLFTVIPADVTDAYIKVASSSGKTVRKTLLENHIDFLLTTEITEASYDSYITTELRKIDDKEYVYYYLNQKAGFTCVCMVQGVADNTVRDVYTFSYDIPSYGTNVTEIGRMSPDGKFEYTGPGFLRKDALDMLKEAAGKLQNVIRNRLLPHYSTSYITLKKDETKNETLANAYKLADKGEYEAALTVFLNNYRSTGYSVSGYNAATIYYALGRTSEALELAKDVFARTAMAEAAELKTRIEKTVQLTNEALAQVNGEARTNQSELIGF